MCSIPSIAGQVYNLHNFGGISTALNTSHFDCAQYIALGKARTGSALPSLS